MSLTSVDFYTDLVVEPNKSVSVSEARLSLYRFVQRSYIVLLHRPLHRFHSLFINNKRRCSFLKKNDIVLDRITSTVYVRDLKSHMTLLS